MFGPSRFDINELHSLHLAASILISASILTIAQLTHCTQKGKIYRDIINHLFTLQPRQATTILSVVSRHFVHYWGRGSC